MGVVLIRFPPGDGDACSDCSSNGAPHALAVDKLCREICEQGALHRSRSRGADELIGTRPNGLCVIHANPDLAKHVIA
jgi:hypothetical protein